MYRVTNNWQCHISFSGFSFTLPGSTPNDDLKRTSYYQFNVHGSVYS